MDESEQPKSYRSPKVHSSWSCADRDGMDQPCVLPEELREVETAEVVEELAHAGPVPCSCTCHGHSLYAQDLENRGFHVHEWRVKVYDLLGAPRKISIHCQGCPMTPPPGISDHIVQN